MGTRLLHRIPLALAGAAVLAAPSPGGPTSTANA
jgi:hypothetical protein